MPRPVRAFLIVLGLSLLSLVSAVGADPAPSNTPVAEKLLRKEVRRIRREFTDLLDRERDTLRVDQTRRRREGDAVRKQRKREWDATEKAARRKFFAETHHGPEKREYMRAFNERRTTFYESLKSEEKIERAELDARWKALREAQRVRLLSIEEYLRRSERPPARLLDRAD